MHLRIGSRGSELALWQSNHIAAQLRSRGHSVSIEVIRTTGDRMQGVAFQKVGTKGMFIKEIEEALLEEHIDLAVHSLKDLPTELDERFVLAAIPRRADPRDAFVSDRFASFASLPAGARVGTSSPRRQAQLRRYRHDVEYIEFRGNVDTRLRKLQEGQAEACVLACAGLDRLGRTELLRERLPASIVCPAAGHGARAIATSAGDTDPAAALAPLDDAETRFAVEAERTALGTLGGGCHVPIGIYCERHTDHWMIHGAVTSIDGSAVVRLAMEHRTDHDPRLLGQRMAESLLEQGAAALLAVG
jgi:hydroxymethylbilane synthase